MLQKKIGSKLGLFCVLLAMASSASAAPKTPVYKAVDKTEPSFGEDWKGAPRRTENEAFLGLGLDYFNAFGFQARYAYRALPEGFIPGINDAFLIEGGLGLSFYGTVNGKSGVTGVNFLAAGRWDFTMNHEWTFFGELGLGYNATSESDAKGSGVFPVVGIGALYAFNPEWALRGDFSYEFLGAGIAYRF